MPWYDRRSYGDDSDPPMWSTLLLVVIVLGTLLGLVWVWAK